MSFMTCRCGTQVIMQVGQLLSPLRVMVVIFFIRDICKMVLSYKIIHVELELQVVDVVVSVCKPLLFNE